MFFYVFILAGVMERNRAADEFANCVVRRGDQDLLLKPSLMIVSLVVPLLVGLLFALAVLEVDAGNGHVNFPEDMLPECILAMGCTAAFTEAGLISFMIFNVTRRNRNHLKRDIVWMDSLSDYVDSRGGDSRVMRSVRGRYVEGTSKAVSLFSMAVWLFIVVTLALLGILMHYVTDLEEGIGLAALALLLVLPMLLVLFLQFIATIGSVLKFPSRHDTIQADFTKALSDACATFGLKVEPMEHTVKKRHAVVHIILTVITLGLYSFVYLIFACRDMNRHLRTQWAYEEDLLERIVDFEGGIGIEPTDEGVPGGAVRLLKKLM